MRHAPPGYDCPFCRLTYTRGNPLGVIYEPWHWRFHADDPAARRTLVIGAT